MAKPKYPEIKSTVTVTFNDGEVKSYMITASPSIGSFLALNAKESGFLTLYNDTECHSIPVDNIREFAITAMPAEAAA
jgi:hypothetical protein